MPLRPGHDPTPGGGQGGSLRGLSRRMPADRPGRPGGTSALWQKAAPWPRVLVPAMLLAPARRATGSRVLRRSRHPGPHRPRRPSVSSPPTGKPSRATSTPNNRTPELNDSARRDPARSCHRACRWVPDRGADLRDDEGMCGRYAASADRAQPATVFHADRASGRLPLTTRPTADTRHVTTPDASRGFGAGSARRDGARRVASPSTRGGTIAAHSARCAEVHLGCPCRGDETTHEEWSRQVTEARARSGEPVDCPECGAATTPLAVLTWGNCRACRTAQSRLTHPLRW